MKRTLSILFSIFLISLHLYAQEEGEQETMPEAGEELPPEEEIVIDTGYGDDVSPFRRFIGKFTFGGSVGYGKTYYNHKTPPFSVGYSPDAGTYLYETQGNIGDTIQIFTNWINNVETSGTIISADDAQVPVDTAELKFKAKGNNYPINAFLFFRFDRYRIGGGYSIEFHNVASFKPTTYQDQIAPINPNINLTTWRRWYGLFGAKFYETYDLTFVADLLFGSLNMGGQFNKALINKGLFFNLGISIEYSLSEYFRVFARPNYEYKTYTIAVSESGGTINHKIPAFYINIGATYRIPELPKCRTRLCQVQMNHRHKHNMKHVRSRMHPFWKRQNPNYGENDKKLIKYRWKNRRNIDAY